MKRKHYLIKKRIPYKGKWYNPGDTPELPCKFGNVLVAIGKAEPCNTKKPKKGKVETKTASNGPVTNQNSDKREPAPDLPPAPDASIPADQANAADTTSEDQPVLTKSEGEAKSDDDVLISDNLAEEAKSEGIDLTKIKGSGLNGRILRQDLQNYKNRMMTSE